MTSSEHTESPSISTMLRMTFEKWYSDDIPRHAAVLAFYALFAVAPILLLCLEILGFVYGRDVAEATVQRQVTSFVSSAETGTWVQSLLTNVLPSSANWWVTVAFIFALIFGASSFFGELKRVLNQIWGVPWQLDDGFGRVVLNRVQAVLMVLVSSLFIFFGFLATSWLSNITDLATRFLNLGSGYATWSYICLIFVLLTLIFALIYKFVPDVEIEWQDVWIGAAATALLISITRLLIVLYFSYSHTTTMFGAASAVVVILLSVYYTAQIFFLGAEFTYVYSRAFGAGVEADADRLRRFASRQSGQAAAAQNGAVSHRWEPQESAPIEFDVQNIAPAESRLSSSATELAESKPGNRFTQLISLAKRPSALWPFSKQTQAADPDELVVDSPTNYGGPAVAGSSADSEQGDDAQTTDGQNSDIQDISIVELSSTAAQGGNDSVNPSAAVAADSLAAEPSAEQHESDGGSTTRKVTSAPIRAVRAVRPVRDVLVAAGVIGALSLTALAGVPFWKRRKGRNGSPDLEAPTENLD